LFKAEAEVLKTFAKGGIHPPETKLSDKSGIRDLPLPKSVTIPLSQHLGSPSRPVVEAGGSVKTGQLIAKSEGYVSSNIHSSVSGKIAKIDAFIDSSGYKRKAIHINVEGDEWVESIDRESKVIKEFSLSSDEIIKKITEAGIVGLGGATFPTHVKLNIPRGRKTEYLIINGVECEPYLTADHALMLEHGEELLVGVSLLKKALKVNRALIGIENNKADAISHIRDIANEYDGIDVYALRVKYPQGGEKQLIKALLNREVPSGGLPIDVGVVAFNVGTTLAVYEAVQKNKPLFERIVTLTGKSVKKPSNFRVRIGTPVSMLIEEAGGLPDDTGKILYGGPMMGKAFSDTSIPVTKGCSGITILAESESLRKKTEPCIRCSKCVSVCPMGLEPYLLMGLSQKNLYERLQSDRVLDCIECGSCSFICPSNRPLLDYIRLGKVAVSKIIRPTK
jgi:electron transport complex protein RnfC